MGSSSASWPTSCGLAPYRSFMCPHLLWSVGARRRKRGWDGCMTLPVQTLFILLHLQPKLSALKSRKNVESFLEACRKMGVPEVWGLLFALGDVGV